MTNLELQIMANEVRKNIVKSVHSAKAGHPGGSLSAADIFSPPQRHGFGNPKCRGDDRRLEPAVQPGQTGSDHPGNHRDRGRIRLKCNN